MRNGFTLIELLAVIVILAIIALIATPLVLNIINDSRESATLRSVDFYLDGVEFAVAQSTLKNKNVKDGIYNLLENGNVCLEYDANNKCISTLKVQVDGEVPNGGMLRIESGKISNHNLIYSESMIVVNGKLRSEKACKITKDEDSDGFADVGDMITCSGEGFYVISNDGTTISMLAEYNLDVGNIYDHNTKTSTAIENPTGIQNKDAKGEIIDSRIYYGVVPFSTTAYWYDLTTDSYLVDLSYIADEREYPFIYGDYKDAAGNHQNVLYPYINAYEEYLISEDVISAKASLMSYEQLYELTKIYQGIDNWVFSTTYWLGSAYFDNLWFADSSEGYNADATYFWANSFGVRPVINVSTFEI